MPQDVAERLDAKLRAFDEQTSSQIVVAVFPELPSPSLEDFTIRTAQSWRVGRKKLDNGVVLFVFVKDRKPRIEVKRSRPVLAEAKPAHLVLAAKAIPSARPSALRARATGRRSR